MPTLEELKDRWFLSLTEQNNALNKRHPKTALSSFADGNLVTTVIDGAEFMKDFHDKVKKMIQFMVENPGAPNPPQVWIANWKMSNVELLGPGMGGHIQPLLLDAADKGVQVYLLHSGPLVTQTFYGEGLIEHAQNLEAHWQFINQLNGKANGFATVDSRCRVRPISGTQHQKFYVCLFPDPKEWEAGVGSADFNPNRWDTCDHQVASPSHEVSVRIQGPAVRDIALTFAERWNDEGNIGRTEPTITTSITIDFLNNPIPTPQEGIHSVQVLRTYPMTPTIADDPTKAEDGVNFGYSWSDQGEFTVWGSYLQAIIRAQTYIYIEDQYFNSFNDPPAFEAPAGLLRDTDLVYQLGEAIKRGVKVAALVPEIHDDLRIVNDITKRQKQLSLAYLESIAQSSPGLFVNRALRVDKQPGANEISGVLPKPVSVLVHSKLMIVDDELALVGTTNFAQRSMTFDSEIHLAIVGGANNSFARDLRLALWAEHLQLTPDERDENQPNSVINRIKNPVEGFEIFRDIVGPGGRRLVGISLDVEPVACCAAKRLNDLAQPYGGPPRSR